MLNVGVWGDGHCQLEGSVSHSRVLHFCSTKVAACSVRPLLSLYHTYIQMEGGTEAPVRGRHKKLAGVYFVKYLLDLLWS